MSRKRVLSIVMSVIMILAMVPSVAFAADAPYDVWAYNAEATQEADKVVLDDSQTVSISLRKPKYLRL